MREEGKGGNEVRGVELKVAKGKGRVREEGKRLGKRKRGGGK